jgi:regulator of sigma E protease
MANFLGSVWWLIVTLGVLVTFHEFGHYWVARRCGVRVLRFSVGFGRALWSRTARDGTEYRIAAIPLGGYVKMLDAREGEVPADQRAGEFTGKPLAQRFAIVAAGPVFNLIFAVAAFWLMFMIGKPDKVPVVGTPPAQTLAATAGFHDGDRLLAIGGQAVATWSDALDTLGTDMMQRKPVAVRVHGADGSDRNLHLALDRLPADVTFDKAFDRIGLQLQPVPPVVATVTPGSPAAHAGLREGDRIVGVNGHATASFGDIGTQIAHLAPKSSTLDFAVQRDGRSLTVPVTAVFSKPDDGPARWNIGIGRLEPLAATLRYGPVRALRAALGSTWDKTAATMHMIGGMLSGQASTRNLSGVITIAQVANTSAHMGLGWFLEFLGLISLSLAILNLLPIPILDGGHLLYYLIELVKGSPVSERTMIAGQFVGMALLVALVGLAFYNDILRLAS